MDDWQPIETAPKNMRRVPGGGRPIEIYAEWARTSHEWAIVEWSEEKQAWVLDGTDEPLVYANDQGWATTSVLWRPLRDPPTKEMLKDAQR